MHIYIYIRDIIRRYEMIMRHNLFDRYVDRQDQHVYLTVCRSVQTVWRKKNTDIWSFIVLIAQHIENNF